MIILHPFCDAEIFSTRHFSLDGTHGYFWPPDEQARKAQACGAGVPVRTRSEVHAYGS